MTNFVNAKIFRRDVIKPVINKLNLGGGDAAEELLLGTAIQESGNFRYRKQMNNGPALSFYQMEPKTHNDIWDNYLKYRQSLADKVTSFLSSPTANRIDELLNNDKYATAMVRIHYLRVPEKIPSQGDLDAQAKYWKRYYNTPLGKGLPREYKEKWNRYILGKI